MISYTIVCSSSAFWLKCEKEEEEDEEEEQGKEKDGLARYAHAPCWRCMSSKGAVKVQGLACET